MDDAKKKILARRARFVAAALSGAMIGCGTSNPSVCLEPAIDAGKTDANENVDTGPMPCLTPLLDTGADVKDATDTSVADTADTGPMPCLVPPLDGG